MEKSRKLILILAALFMSLSVHASSAWAQGGSPETVVKDFAKAYFMMDSSMGAYLSEDALMDENEADIVDLYLESRALEARDRGYKMCYLQMHPIILKTKVLNIDDSSADIQFEAITLRSINPLFRIVGFVFGLLEEHEYKDVITVVKQDGEWKIAPGALDMPM